MSRRHLLGLVAAGSLLHLAGGPAAAAAIRNITGFTQNTLAANNDGSTAGVTLGFTINFFGTSTNTVFVNNNGNISLGAAVSLFNPQGIASAVTQPMIAPFFADVDTRGAGSGVAQYGTATLCGRNAFGVNWINVGYFNSAVNKLNSFQLILIDRSDTGAGNFDIEMNYDQILWETGTGNGGTNGVGGQSALVGYTNGAAGAARVSFTLPGSSTPGALLDGGPNALSTGKLDATVPGRFHFFIRNGQPTPASTALPAVAKANLSQDVTPSVRVYMPLRWDYNPRSGVYAGGVTLSRLIAGVTTNASATNSGSAQLAPLSGAAATSAAATAASAALTSCLDETSAASAASSGASGVAAGVTVTTTVTTTVTGKAAPRNLVGANVVVTTQTTKTTSPGTSSPVVVIFTQLPPQVTLASPTGTTKRGFPYLRLSSSLPPEQSLQFLLSLRNPANVYLSTYYSGHGFSLQVLVGPFDPNLF